MALNLKKKILLAAAIAGAIGVGTVSGQASAYVEDFDNANLNGAYCDFDRDWYQAEVEWGNNRSGNRSIEVKGTLRFFDLQGGSCQLYIRYYDNAGSIVGTDTHTINHNWPTPAATYAAEGHNNLSIEKARVCTRSHKQFSNNWGNYRCVNVLRGD